MSNVVSLFTGDRAEGKAAHRRAGLNPDYGLGLPDDRTDAEIANAERRSLLTASITALQKALSAEEQYRDALRRGQPEGDLLGFAREAARLRSEAAWSLGLIDTPTLRGGAA